MFCPESFFLSLFSWFITLRIIFSFRTTSYILNVILVCTDYLNCCHRRKMSKMFLLKKKLMTWTTMAARKVNQMTWRMRRRVMRKLKM